MEIRCLRVLFLFSGVFSNTIGSTVKPTAELNLEETVLYLRQRTTEMESRVSLLEGRDTADVIKRMKDDLLDAETKSLQQKNHLLAKMEEMETESRNWRNDLSAKLQELQQWTLEQRDEVLKRVSELEMRSEQSTTSVAEKLRNAESKFKKVDNHLLMEVLQIKPMLKVTAEKMRSVEEQVTNALERERLKTHSLQVQMTELKSELHPVDIIRKNMSSMADNLRLQLNDSLSNLTRSMRIFENSSMKFLKDCANSSYVSKLGESLEKLEKSVKNELRTLQSELSPRLEKLEDGSVLSDDVMEMKKTLSNHSSSLSRLNQHLWEVENTCAGEPPSILNGKPMKFDRKPKSVVQYECDEDFVVTGNSTVLCEYGRWEGHPPVCSLHTCESEPPSMLNGKPLKFDRKPKSIVQYECDENFVLTGNSTVLCVHGRWVGYPPICILGTCAGEPPSIRNGKPLKFDRKHKSMVQYECDQDFVLTGNSTVLCEYGKWEGHPPICSFFDATFTLVANVYDNHDITCYSDRYSQNIEFSRVVDTGSGGGLPMPNRQEGAVLSYTGKTPYREMTGAFECRFHVDNRSAGIVVPIQVYGDILFPHRSEVANIGDTVQFTVELVSSSYESKLRWRHNGVLVPAWDGQTKVEISVVKPADAGIYECYHEGERSNHQALFRLIVRKCEKNRYGGNCEKQCPVCYNGGTCHDLLGMCICPIGFTGNNCEFGCGENHVRSDCPDLCLGVFGCKNKLFCKPDPYGCSCFPGFRGPWCKERCYAGWYGADCKQKCHCASGCNSRTGACNGECSKGWTGPSCQIEVLN